MSRELLKKPVAPMQREPEKPKVQSAAYKPRENTRTDEQKDQAKAKATQRLKKTLEITSVALAENNLQRADRVAAQEEAQVQRQDAVNLKAAEEARVQRLQEVQAKQQAFFSSFTKSPAQRSALQSMKNSSIEASQARAAHQAVLVPGIVQRLVNDQITVQAQQARATQKPNELITRADWFNTELPCPS